MGEEPQHDNLLVRKNLVKGERVSPAFGSDCEKRLREITPIHLESANCFPK